MRSLEKPKQQDETHLSGAYIRSLVKQLSSSRSKESSPPLGDAKDGELHETQQQQQRPPGSPKSRPQKKQVRRRLHTTRPYQERLFNMAEARREIVAALKLHRAAMKQPNNQPHEQKQQEQTMASASTELVYSTGNCPFNGLPDYDLSGFFHGSTPFPPTAFPSPELPSTCSPFTPFSMSDHLNFHLPDHPLGLNLDLQSFQNIDASVYCNQTLQEPSSPPASSLSCSNSSPKAISGVASSSQQTSQAPAVHLAMDDEEMAEIQSIGEQHDIEWNDKMNSATSAWWSKLLKSMEGGLESDGGAGGDGLRVSDEFFGSPSWPNDGIGATAKDSNSPMLQHLDEYFRVEDYLESFDAGEIEYQEGGEWLPQR